MATKEPTQLGYFQQKELEDFLLKIAINNSVGKGHPCPQGTCLLGVVLRMDTHCCPKVFFLPPAPVLPGRNSCSGNQLSRSEHSVSAESHQEPDTQVGDNGKGWRLCTWGKDVVLWRAQGACGPGRVSYLCVPPFLTL